MSADSITPIEQWRQITRSVPRAYAAASDDEVRTLLTGIGDLLVGILQELQGQVQNGVVVSVPLTVNALVPPWNEAFFAQPLFSVTLINDGGGIVQFRIPNDPLAGWIDLHSAEQFTFNYIKAKVISVGLRLPTGQAAQNVRVLGSY